MFSATTIIWICAAGFFFMLANLAMKLLAGHSPFLLYGAVAVAIMAGACCEVQALKSAQLGHAVVMILALEIAFSLIVAMLWLNETYSARDLLGFLLVAGGIYFLAGSHDRSEAEPAQEKTVQAESVDTAPAYGDIRAMEFATR